MTKGCSRTDARAASLYVGLKRIRLMMLCVAILILARLVAKLSSYKGGVAFTAKPFAKAWRDTALMFE